MSDPPPYISPDPDFGGYISPRPLGGAKKTTLVPPYVFFGLRPKKLTLPSSGVFHTCARGGGGQPPPPSINRPKFWENINHPSEGGQFLQKSFKNWWIFEVFKSKNRSASRARCRSPSRTSFLVKFMSIEYRSIEYSPLRDCKLALKRFFLRFLLLKKSYKSSEIAKLLKK